MTEPTLADLFRGTYLASGTDFASIRVHHAGAGADLACRVLGARAFTVGSDIYFAAGAFRPDTRGGLWLLAHEVAHVVQQSAGLVRTPRDSRWAERGADAAADALVAGRPFVFSGAGRPARPASRRCCSGTSSGSPTRASPTPAVVCSTP